MVGSFSEANTSACVASRTEGVEPPSQHETKWRQSIQLPWSCSRSDTARRQPSEQSTLGWMQAKQPPLSGEQGRIFILTSPLIGFLGGLYPALSARLWCQPIAHSFDYQIFNPVQRRVPLFEDNSERGDAIGIL